MTCGTERARAILFEYKITGMDKIMKDFFDRYINKENFKKIIDWCMKNRRFFLAAVLFVALIVLLKNCTGQSSTGESVSGTETETVGQTEGDTDAIDFDLDSDFEQDAHEEVNQLIAAYFDAYASADIDTLETIASPVSENEKSYIRVFSQYIESYENIVCYTKAGLDDNSYLVSAYFDLKFYDVATTAPGLDFFYVETAEDGTVFINNRYSSYNLSRTENDLDSNIYAVILKFEQQEDSVALREQVEQAYSDAVASDVDLATMLSTTIPNAMNDWMNSIAEADADASGENETETAEGTEQETGENDQDAAQTEEPSDQTVVDENNPDASQTETPADQTDANENDQDAAAVDDNGQDAAQDGTDNGDAEQEETAKQVVKVKITAKSVNVRKEPNTSSEVIGKVKKGETYTEMDDLDGWFEISYDGQTGYVSADYVTEVTE
jgi:hypothetical protein